MIDTISEIISELSENKLAVGVVGVILGAILTKLIPYLWTGLVNLILWLGTLVGGRFSYRTFERHYLDWIVTEHRELKLTGIVISDDTKKPKLEQVFVSLALSQAEARLHTKSDEPYVPIENLSYKELKKLLQLQEEQSKSRVILGALGIAERQLGAIAKDNIWRRLAKLLRYDVAPQEQRESAISWMSSWKHVLRDALEDSQLRYLLSGELRVAILGAPGAGKTTLLQYIALAFARARAGDPKLCDSGATLRKLGVSEWRLPIFVRLSSVAGALSKAGDDERDFSIIDILPRLMPPDLQSEKVALEFLVKQVRAGNCIFLFDGLDEVPTASEFAAVTRAVESLVLRHPGNRFFITSRIAGWRGGVQGDFTVFHVNDLTDQQVDRFVDIWYRAVEQISVVGRLEDEGHAERNARERRAERRASDLKRTLQENVGIRRLATNPMLLSIIALVHRSLATLPKERSKLYSQCSKVLLEQWDISRGVRVDDTNLKLEQKEAIMRRLAIALHTGEIGDEGGGREASRGQVNAVIEKFLPGIGRTAEDAPHLLQRLVERSGILVERRRDILSFAHHTFQEYFAAQYLAIGESAEHRSFLLDKDRLSSEWWQEVILLYSGLLSDSSDFLKSVLDQDSDSDLLLRNLRLAGLCLAEAIEVRAPGLRWRITQEFLKVREVDAEASFTERPIKEVTNYLIRWGRSSSWYGSAATVCVQGMRRGGRELDALNLLSASLREKDSMTRESALEAIASSDYIPPNLTEEIMRMIRSVAEGERYEILWWFLALPPAKLSGNWDVGYVKSLVEAYARQHDSGSEALEYTFSSANMDMLRRVLPTETLRSWLKAGGNLGEFAASILARLEEDGAILSEIITSSGYACFGLDESSEDLIRKLRLLPDLIVGKSIPLQQLTAVSQIIELLQDKRAEVRSASAEVLIELILRSPSGGDLLAKILIEHPAVSSVLATARYGGMRRAKGFFISPDTAWIRYFTGSVPEGVVPILLSFLSSNAKLKEFAAYAIRAVIFQERRSEVFTRLKGVLGDMNYNVRSGALKSLAKIALSKEQKEEVATFVIASLRSRRAVMRISALVASLDVWDIIVHKGNEREVVNAAVALRMPIYKSLLSRVMMRTLGLQFSEHTLEHIYTRSLLGIGERLPSLDILEKLFEVDFLGVRMIKDDVARFVSLLPPDRLVGFIKGILGKPTIDVDRKVFALQVLAIACSQKEWPEVRSLILALLADERGVVQRFALETLKSLARFSDPREISEMVSEKLDSDNGDIREEAWGLLRSVGYVKSNGKALSRSIINLPAGYARIEDSRVTVTEP